MFDRETRRAKILEARGRAKRDARAKSAQGEVGFTKTIIFVFFFKSICFYFLI